MRPIPISTICVNGRIIHYQDYSDEEFAVVDNVLIMYNGEEEVVNIPDGIEKIDVMAFKACEARRIIIPDSVNEIAGRAFEDCRELESIKLPPQIKVLENGTFMRCWKLCDVSLSPCLKEIKNGVFWECSSIQSIIIPDDIDTIGESAFSGCFNLREVILSKSIKEIGDDCFERCDKLESINIPETIKKIGNNAVPDHTSIMVNIDGKPIEYLSQEKQYANQYNKKVDISNPKTAISDVSLSKEADLEVEIMSRKTVLRVLSVMTKCDPRLWMDYARYADEKALKVLFSKMKQWEKDKKDKRKNIEDKVLLANVRGALKLNENKMAQAYFNELRG